VRRGSRSRSRAPFNQRDKTFLSRDAAAGRLPHTPSAYLKCHSATFPLVVPSRMGSAGRLSPRRWIVGGATSLKSTFFDSLLFALSLSLSLSRPSFARANSCYYSCRRLLLHYPECTRPSITQTQIHSKSGLIIPARRSNKSPDDFSLALQSIRDFFFYIALY